MDKPLPQNNEMEMAVIGCMMVDREYARMVIDRMDPRWFYSEKNEKIFKVLKMKIEDGHLPDIVMATQWMSDAGILAEVGGREYLVDTMESMATGAHIQAYILHLRQLFHERNIHRALVVAKGAPTPENIEALRAASQERDCAAVNGIIRVSDCMAEVEEMMLPMAKGMYDLFNMGTVDERHNGQEPGNVLTIAARPGVGKTVMATHIAMQFLRKYKEPVLYFSTEMEHRETMMRILAPMSRVPGWKWRKRYFNDEDKNKVGVAYKEFLAQPFFMMDKPAPSLADIRAGMIFTKCKLVIIDYLQRMNHEEGRDGLPQAIGRTMKGIKDAARSLGALAVVLSQMDRETDHLKGRATPQLADLKGSGDIEQESDAVFLMWKHNKKLKGGEKGELTVPDCVLDSGFVRPVELIHAKDRHGVSDVSTQLIFDEKYIEFREWNKATEAEYRARRVESAPPREITNGNANDSASGKTDGAGKPGGWSFDKNGNRVDEDDDGDAGI